MLEINDLKVNYGAIEAVKGISFKVNKGELVTLLGANGAGKSSTLMCIGGALKPASGSIFLEGQNIASSSPELIAKSGVMVVPETRDVFPDLTVKENLLLGGYIIRKNKTLVQESLEKMMTFFPRLKERSGQAAGTLSGGEQQMLVIARGLMSDPKVLLLDEPSLGLAPAIVEQIFEMIQQLKSSGLTILLVEQNARKGLSVADYAHVLQLGKIAASGSAEELNNSEALNKLYLGGQG